MRKTYCFLHLHTVQSSVFVVVHEQMDGYLGSVVVDMCGNDNHSGFSCFSSVFSEHITSKRYLSFNYYHNVIIHCSIFDCTGVSGNENTTV